MYHNPFVEFMSCHDQLTFIVVFLLCALQIARFLSCIVEWYRRWLWVDMDKEERYYLVKVPKW